MHKVSHCSSAATAIENPLIMLMDFREFAHYLGHIANCKECYELAKSKRTRHHFSKQWISGAWHSDGVLDELIAR